VVASIGRRWEDVRRLARVHWLLVAILAVGALVRAGVAIAYSPSLMYGDSWDYVNVAFKEFPVGISPVHPSGYPLVLRILSLPGREPAVWTGLQHAAGLGTAVLTYALALRLSAGRVAAAGAAAFVALDGYAIALEQHVLSEALFALALTASMYLAVTARTPLGLGASGLLLAAAVTMRAVGLFAVPAWALYVLWTRRDRRTLAVAAAALALPLLAYSTAHYAKTRQFGVVAADGWYLYARVAPIADCDGVSIPEGTEGLCDKPAGPRAADPDFYLWDEASPARRVYGDISEGSTDRWRFVDSRMKGWARAHIEARPGRYARDVGDEFVRFFRPGGGGIDSTIELPRSAEEQRINDHPEIRPEHLPDWSPSARWPAAAVRDYASAVHLPRWAMGILALASLVAVAAAAALRRRVRMRHVPEIALLAGAALGILLATSATNALWLRYLVPVAPLLSCAGVAALVQLAAVARDLRRPVPAN
jgi:hypothetical protein